MGKNIDVKEMNSLLEKSKEETFCNIDGYCQFDVVGKIITPKKAIIVTSDIYSSLQDESDQYMSVGVLTLPNQTGWIKVKYWVPATYDDVKSIRISSDKKYLYMKDNAGKETKEKL